MVQYNELMVNDHLIYNNTGETVIILGELSKTSAKISNFKDRIFVIDDFNNLSGKPLHPEILKGLGFTYRNSYNQFGKEDNDYIIDFDNYLITLKECGDLTNRKNYDIKITDTNENHRIILESSVSYLHELENYVRINCNKEFINDYTN